MDPRRESLYWREENNPGARPRRWSAQFRRGGRLRFEVVGSLLPILLLCGARTVKLL
jgi:hypothetical protein